MTETMLPTRIVRVTIREGHPGLFFATSPDLGGLFVAKESLEDAIGAVPVCIAALYEACGEPVIVEPLADNSTNPTAKDIIDQIWVAMPVVAAEAAVARFHGASQRS